MGADMDQAIALHWMAQAERRLDFPVDSTEDGGWSAFEYAWKALHSVCEDLETTEGNAAQKIERSLKAKIGDLQPLVVLFFRARDQVAGCAIP
jgi:hypothetical protein